MIQKGGVEAVARLKRSLRVTCAMLPALGIALLAASSLASARNASGLHTRAVAAGKLYLGTAVDNIVHPSLLDPEYVAGLTNVADFGQVTVGNAQKVSLSYMYTSQLD